MKKTHLIAAASAGAIVVALVATNASAYTGSGSTNTVTPPWETGNTLFTSAPNYPNLDPNSKGGLKFYDAAGAEITGGNDLSTIGNYIATTGTAARSNASLAYLLFAVPDHTKSTVQWVTTSATGANPFPATAPGPVLAATVPVASLDVLNGEGGLSAVIGVISNDTTTGYDHILQVRVKDSGIGVPTSGLNSINYYWSADIEYNNTASAFSDGLAAGSWKVVYPAPSVPTTTPTTVSDLTPTPASPAAHGTSPALSATVAVQGDATTHPAGSVHYFDGATDLGAATYDASTGLATFTDSRPPADNGHSYVAKFTPTDAATYAASQSNALSYTITPAVLAADHTATTIAGTSPNGTATTGDTVTVTAHVADTDTPATVVTAGTVTVKAGTTVLGTGTPNGSGDVVVTFPAGAKLALGANSLTAEYVGTSAFGDSTTASPTTYTLTLADPTNVIAPSASARVGVASFCNPGSWLATFGLTYEWFQRSSSLGSWVSFATTQATAALPASDAGRQVKCVVTAFNTGASSSAETLPLKVALGAASVVKARPAISGTPKVGSKLKASAGVWSPKATSYVFTWKVGKTVVSRSSSWKPSKAYKGKYVVLVVTAVRAGYLNGVATSASVRIR